MKVLIESDWNLKQGSLENLESNEYVLIESDWNLKFLKWGNGTASKSY